MDSEFRYGDGSPGRMPLRGFLGHCDRLPYSRGKQSAESAISGELDFTGCSQTDARSAEPGRSEFWNSTLFDIENCDFSNCARVMDLSCDLAVIRNSRIATPKAQKGPVFLLMNQVYFRNVKGMGSGSKTDSPYWIDISATVENKALLYVDECEFDVKGADGWCLVKSNLKPGYISTAIRVADSRIRSAGCPEGGIVSLAAGTSPNLIAIRNVTDPSGCAVRAVSYGNLCRKTIFSTGFAIIRIVTAISHSASAFQDAVTTLIPN